jgi:hypothetical protein
MKFVLFIYYRIPVLHVVCNNKFDYTQNSITNDFCILLADCKNYLCNSPSRQSVVKLNFCVDLVAADRIFTFTAYFKLFFHHISNFMLSLILQVECKRTRSKAY